MTHIKLNYENYQYKPIIGHQKLPVEDILYDERQLLGMDDKDIDKVEDLLLAQLTKGL